MLARLCRLSAGAMSAGRKLCMAVTGLLSKGDTAQSRPDSVLQLASVGHLNGTLRTSDCIKRHLNWLQTECNARWHAEASDLLRQSYW